MPPAPDLDGAPKRVLVMDFDGTVCLGDGVVWAYAEAALREVASEAADRVRRALSAYLRGDTEQDWADGYSAVAQLAGPLVPSEALEAAYQQSRTALCDENVEIRPPAGLAGLLAELAPSVLRLVVTNAPDTGLDAALRRLGLTDCVDGVVASAGKPGRSVELLNGLLGPRTAVELISVGDFWRNDIAPALELGCATAFVDHSGRDPRPAHVRARTFQALYPAIREWAAAPQSFVTNHPVQLQPVPTDT